MQILLIFNPATIKQPRPKHDHTQQFQISKIKKQKKSCIEQYKQDLIKQFKFKTTFLLSKLYIQ